MLIMGFADTGRVLINDRFRKGKVKAHVVNPQREKDLKTLIGKNTNYDKRMD